MGVRFTIAVLTFALGATVVAVRMESAQRQLLQQVAEPKDERVVQAPAYLETQVVSDLDRSGSRFRITADGKRITIEQDQDEVFLTAYISEKKAWTVGNRPTAEPIDPQYATARGWNFLAVRFSRAGMFLYDLTTGKSIAEDGYDWSITMSPDRKWGILQPYYSPAQECYVATAFLRIAPGGKTTSIDTTPLTPDQLCSTDRSDHAVIDAVVSPNGRFYAIVPASKRFLSPGNGTDGILELFQASDNRKLVSLRTKFPGHFKGVFFSASSNYVVLKDAAATGQLDETRWFRINR
jgi:hypothetical protein